MSSAATLIGMLLLAIAVLVWLALRALHERALGVAVSSCKEAGLQLLDSTVSLQRVNWAREDGHYGWRVDYSFDVSADGQQRRQGRIRFHQGTLLWVEVPRANDQNDLWVGPSRRD